MLRAIKPIFVFGALMAVFWTISDIAYRAEPLTALEEEARRKRLDDPTKLTDVPQLQPPIWMGPGVAAWDGLIGVHAIRSGPLELTVTPLQQPRHRFGAVFTGLERIGYRATVLVSGAGLVVLELHDARGEHNGTAEVDLNAATVVRIFDPMKVEARRRTDGFVEIQATLSESNGYLVLGLYLQEPTSLSPLRFRLVELGKVN